MKQIATDNYDFERLITEGYSYIDYRTAFKSLVTWYDSYRFSPFSTERVLNPVAVGKAIPSGLLINYWSKTGMPTLILERLQACDKRPDNIDEPQIELA